jgi:hypothetical protein
MVSTETVSQDAQLNPLPQLAADGAPHGIAELEPPVEAAKVESCFSALADLHDGQFTVSSALDTNSSNLWPQSAHLYSNTGMLVLLLYSESAVIAPITAPTDVVSQGLHITCQVEPKNMYAIERPKPTAPPMMANNINRFNAFGDLFMASLVYLSPRALQRCTNRIVPRGASDRRRHYFSERLFHISGQFIKTGAGEHLADHGRPSETDDCLAAFGVHRKLARHEQRDVHVFLKRLMGKTRVADFDNLQGSALKTFLRECGLNIVHM